MTKFLFTILTGLAVMMPTTASAQVLINEIAWMGTVISANDEWLELYNPSDQPVNLDGWQLKTIDGSPMINLTGSIVAKGYFLLERTDDETVPGMPADQIFSGTIGNTGEYFQLFDTAGNIIDQAPFTNGWPAGDNTTKQTLERSTVDSWQTSLQPNGTPGTKNSTTPTETPKPPIPECPVAPECPAVPECPIVPDLNATIEVEVSEIPGLIDGQKIKIHGLVSKRPLFFLGHILMVDNLKILILGNPIPRPRIKSNIEATGRLLQTPIGPIMIVYQASDITMTNY